MSQITSDRIVRILQSHPNISSKNPYQNWGHFMLEAITCKSMLNDIASRDKTECVKGIIMAHPGSQFATSILNKLSYLHHRSGENINIYFAGYGAYWNGEYPDEQLICKIDNVQWSFSSKMFSEFINEIETISKWRYNGETELLLLTYRQSELDFSDVLILWMDRMIDDKAIYSSDYLFENIFRYFKRDKSVYNYSDSQVVRVLGVSILDTVKKALFNNFSTTFDKAKYFCIKDLS